MEEQIGYKIESDHDNKWNMPAKSRLSLESEENDMITNLQIIQKRQARLDKPIIPATWAEQLSYYRCYVSSPSKSQIVCMQHVKFNRFLWYYVIHVFFKTLPHTYVYVFLASYAADHHFFLPKMVPITWGFNIAYIIAALCEITLIVDNTTRCLDYFLTGLYYKNPWNRCAEKHFFAPEINRTVDCYPLDLFKNTVENKTLVYENHYYVLGERYFQFSQVVFYRLRNEFLKSTFPFSLSTLYTAIIWFVMAVCHKQLFKRYVWKIMHYVQYAMNGCYLLALIHMTAYFFLKSSEIIIPPETFNELKFILWSVDVDILAESMTTPPIAHIITARSNIEINVSRDSAVIVVSNAINFILRGLISYRVKRHCEYLATVPITVTPLNQNSFYYFWPIYFSSLGSLGEFCSIFFFFINFMSELITTIITFQCLVEVIVCEWRNANRVSITCVLILFGLALFAFKSYNGIMIMYVYGQGITTLCEVIGIYILYPVGRLIEDITFYHGCPPNSLRIFNLLCVPVFYTFRFYTMIIALFQVCKASGKEEYINQMKLLWIPLTAPIVIGAMYIIYRYKLRKHGGKWSELFCPLRHWGPKDNTVRQLRKLFNSRKYIGSQADIMLSRYMIRKEQKVYRLYIKYDSFSVRSTMMSVTPSEMRFVIETEKKNV